MAIVEIWKARPSWSAVPLSKREKIIERLANVIKSTHLSGVGSRDVAPFLIQKVEICLLVWISQMDETEVAAEYAETGLTEYFEPLAYATATPYLSAKVLVERLSN